MQSGSLDQLNDLSGLEDCGTFFLVAAVTVVALVATVDADEIERGVPNVGGGGPEGGQVCIRITPSWFYDEFLMSTSASARAPTGGWSEGYPPHKS